MVVEWSSVPSAVLVVIVVFFIARELICGYWKINRQVTLLTEIRDLLLTRMVPAPGFGGWGSAGFGMGSVGLGGSVGAAVGGGAWGRSRGGADRGSSLDLLAWLLLLQCGMTVSVEAG